MLSLNKCHIKMLKTSISTVALFEVAQIAITGENCLFKSGCKPEQHMMYSGSKANLVKELGFTKVNLAVVFH